MSNQTFLPEDYLAQKSERRTNLICLTLFATVMTAVFSAFLWTNRQWSRVKDQQQVINVDYQKAAVKIEELNELDGQRRQMLHKAELVAALVERVPRSILLAELINRMPNRLGLLQFKMTSEKAKVRKNVPDKGSGSLKGKGKKKAKRGKTRKEASKEAAKIEAPRYTVNIDMKGVAPTDLEVSTFLSELNSYELFEHVTLRYSEEKEIAGRPMREFRITMSLARTADVRAIDTLENPRDPKNPMLDTVAVPVGPAFGPGNGGN